MTSGALAEWAQHGLRRRPTTTAPVSARGNALLEPTEFVVRRFERDSFVDGSLFQDFLDAVGIDVRADELQQVLNRNESLDAEAVEFLRLLNVYRVQNEGAEPRHHRQPQADPRD